MTSIPIDQSLMVAAHAGTIYRRSTRVVILITTIAILSVADLYLTLLFVGSVGMGEGNPIARLVISTFNSNFILAAWKIASVIIACGIFYKARRTRFGEFGAWVAFLLLVWLVFRWAAYADGAASLTSLLPHISAYEEARWVRIDS